MVKKTWLIVALAAALLVGLASCSLVTYTVNLYQDASATVPYEVIVVGYGEVIEEPEPPVKDGYTFIGWRELRDFSNPWEFSAPITQSLHFIPMWELNED